MFPPSPSASWPPAAQPWDAIDLPHSHAAVAMVRNRLREVLGDAAVPQNLLHDAVIVAGELVLNAIEHGRAGADGTIQVAWHLDGTDLVLRVIDAGQGPVITTEMPLEDDLRGRGLAMVEALCADWQMDRGDHTTVVARIARGDGSVL